MPGKLLAHTQTWQLVLSHRYSLLRRGPLCLVSGWLATDTLPEESSENVVPSCPSHACQARENHALSWGCGGSRDELELCPLCI